MTAWEKHLKQAKEKSLRVLKRRPKSSKPPIFIDKPELFEMETLFQTAPHVLEKMKEWNQERPLEKKDSPLLYRAEKTFYSQMMLSKKSGQTQIGSFGFYSRLVGILFLTIGILWFFWVWLVTEVLHIVHTPWFAGWFLIWVILGIEWNQIKKIINARYGPKKEQLKCLEIQNLAQQCIKPAQMIERQLFQGFKPTWRQWRKIDKWIKEE